MPISLDEIVPWGRSFDEYVQMFALSEDDLDKHILGCGDGPAAFNAALTQRGGCVVSADPIYAFSATEIRRRIDETQQTVLAQVKANREAFIWKQIPSVSALGEIRMQAMADFLFDYAADTKGHRYRYAELPSLPFADRSFDLAVCSHLLFLYSEQLSETFHIQAVAELIRLSPEVRIFPLLDLDGTPSDHLDPVIQFLESSGHTCSIEPVDYEFQKGGNQMLRITAGRVA